jgi:hypothetical protein
MARVLCVNKPRPRRHRTSKSEFPGEREFARAVLARDLERPLREPAVSQAVWAQRKIAA